MDTQYCPLIIESCKYKCMLLTYLLDNWDIVNPIPVLIHVNDSRNKNWKKKYYFSFLYRKEILYPDNLILTLFQFIYWTSLYSLTDAYTTADVDYRWKGGDDQGIEIVSAEMAQFDLVGVSTRTKAQTNSKGMNQKNIILYLYQGCAVLTFQQMLMGQRTDSFNFVFKRTYQV